MNVLFSLSSIQHSCSSFGEMHYMFRYEFLFYAVDENHFTVLQLIWSSSYALYTYEIALSHGVPQWFVI